MLRALVKTGVAYGLDRMGLVGRASRRLRPADVPRVVGYHRIVERFCTSPGMSLPSMLTSRPMLERHLEWMGRQYGFLPLNELEPSGTRPRAVAVTFDDGYRDFYLHAFPLLRRMGVPACVFVVTSLVGTSRLQLHDRLYLRLVTSFERWRSPERALERLLFRLDIEPPSRSDPRSRPKDPASATRMLLRGLNRDDVERVIEALQAEVELDESRFEELLPLTWDMLDEMQRAGITVGSHTRSHVSLPRETREKVEEEIVGSRRDLERRLGIPVDDFAYPDGQFDDVAVEAVARAGYTRAFTTCLHRAPRNSMLTIPRTLLWERSCVDPLGRFSPEITRCQLDWIFDAASGCERRHQSVAAIG